MYISSPGKGQSRDAYSTMSVCPVSGPLRDKDHIGPPGEVRGAGSQ